MSTINTRMRLSGLASGMDTETMVKDLMKAQSAPLNKLKQKKQLEEWKRDSYREMNSLLLDLRDNTMSKMKLQGTFDPKKLTNSNESKVSAAVSGSPSFSSYVISSATLSSPATGASATFTNSIPDGNTKFTDLASGAMAAGSNFTFTVNGNKANGSLGTAKTITINASDTITDVINNINSYATDTNVRATYDQATKAIVFMNTVTGDKSGVEITATSAASNVLNISNGKVDNTTVDFNTDANANSQCVKGTNVTPGSVTINGTVLSLTSNTFTFDGIKFSVKENIATPVTITSETDTDAIFNTIKDFVEKYNEVIEKVNKKTSETKYKGFQPLLDEEREALSEKQIEQWEAKAKSGVLRRDQLLSGVLVNMRKSISSDVQGITDVKFNNISEIGITPAKADKNAWAVNYSENGKLYIDEAKLKEAISQNPKKVMELFTKKSTSTDQTTKFNENGIAFRMYDQLASSINQIIDTAGTSISPEDSEYYAMGRSMRRINKDMARWEDRLQRIEDRYWKQYTAMEKALSQMQSQSNWLASQTG